MRENNEARINSLLEQMTIEEKVSLLAGDSVWTTPAIERLGIPALKMTDGPNGARGGSSFVGEIPAACFPAGIALAATWNTTLVEQVGQALGEEAKSKGAHLLLAPTVNMHRSPLNGRNFECYAEDPHLSAQMAVAYIKGVQSQKVGAVVKHFVSNDSEFERRTINTVVSERSLREIYLPPFKAAVQAGKSWAIMAAYNRLNGTYCSENSYILLDILKDEWGFDGLVMSDWYGSQSTAVSVNNGLDLEMPGPPVWRGERLLKAIKAGHIEMTRVDDSVRRLLRVLQRTGAFEKPTAVEEQAINKPEHQAIARQAAAESIVLLKNEAHLLPLDRAKLNQIAIIGPNAKTAVIMGGGSARVNAHYTISPFDAITALVGDSVDIGYALGCTNHKELPLIEPNRFSLPDGRPGLTAVFHKSHDLSGDVILQKEIDTAEQLWLGEICPQVHHTQISGRISTQFTPAESGQHTFGLMSAGLSRLFIDGQHLLDNWSHQERGDSFFGAGSTEVTGTIHLEAGQAYQLLIEYSSEGTSFLAGVRLGCLSPIAADAIQQAANLAAAADVALLFIGSNGDWEGEGHDRPDMALVGEQGALVEAVTAVNLKTVVILQTGSPVAMPWLDEVTAVMQAWFPGQECGHAIADVLFGTTNPSGKLPQTFPKRLEDNPTFINYPGENGQVTYGENIFVGYRYYEKKKIAPLFPFGFGLSYTTFALGNLSLSKPQMAPDDSVELTAEITNTGERRGQEVVQLYVQDVVSGLVRPLKELKSFIKVELEPAETKTVRFTMTAKELAYFDDQKRGWLAEAGHFMLLLGTSSQAIHASAALALTESKYFDA